MIVSSSITNLDLRKKRDSDTNLVFCVFYQLEDDEVKKSLNFLIQFINNRILMSSSSYIKCQTQLIILISLIKNRKIGVIIGSTVNKILILRHSRTAVVHKTTSITSDHTRVDRVHVEISLHTSIAKI